MNEKPSNTNRTGEPELTAGELIERELTSRPSDDPLRHNLAELLIAMRVQEARSEKLEQVVKERTCSADVIGTFLEPHKEKAHVVVNGRDYCCNVDPCISLAHLKRGTRVLLNEARVVVGDLGFETSGPVMKVAKVLASDRVRVGGEQGVQSLVLQRSPEVLKEKLRIGDEVRVDMNSRVIIEVLPMRKTDDNYLYTVPDLSWDRVGGQREAVRAIRDAFELPLLHPDLFKKYRHAQPKGFLLYGPPGCGKTLIGKATAYNLTQKLKEQTGEKLHEYFLHIKGSDILNMWVGESERMMSEIFHQAREKRSEGYLPYLFIDEAESILGIRRAGRWNNILSTLIPIFCTEMDGIESLRQMVIILASNRADLIDPAVLRAGRIDRRIKINRPNREDAAEIYKIYLTVDLPFDPHLVDQQGGVKEAVDYLVNKTIEQQFAQDEANKWLQVTLRSGRKEMLYRGDLCSGAIIASIVERAKVHAIKRAIASTEEEGITMSDLIFSLENEYAESDIFPVSDNTEDWIKLIDYDPENVVKVSPVRSIDSGNRSSPASIV